MFSFELKLKAEFPSEPQKGRSLTRLEQALISLDSWSHGIRLVLIQSSPLSRAIEFPSK